MEQIQTGLTDEMRASISHVERLLSDFLTRKKAGALVELSYANPVPYTKLVEAAEQGKTDYFLCRDDFEGPALKEMGNRIAQENIASRRSKLAEFKRNAGQITSPSHDIRSAFEIGPGTGKKISHLLKSKLGNQLQNLGLIDKQADFTNAAAEEALAAAPQLNITQIGQDIFSEAGRHKFSSKTLGMILGGTISNVTIDGYPNETTEFPKEQFTNVFNVLSAYFSETEGGSLLVSVDASDIQTMINGYRDRPGTSYNTDFSMAALDFIEQLFEAAYNLAPPEEKDMYVINITSEDPELQGKEKISFRDIYRTEEKYFSKSQLSSHCVVVDRDATVTFGRGKHERFSVKLEAGWYNATVISAKPRAEQLASAAAATGRFLYADKTRQSEMVDENPRKFRAIDVMRFHFVTAAKNDNAQPKQAATKNVFEMLKVAIGGQPIENPAVFSRS